MVYVVHSHTAYIENSVHQYYNFLTEGIEYLKTTYKTNKIKTLDKQTHNKK